MEKINKALKRFLRRYFFILWFILVSPFVLFIGWAFEMDGYFEDFIDFLKETWK